MKKEYENPKMEVVKLKAQSAILNGSPDDEYGTGVGTGDGPKNVDGD